METILRRIFESPRIAPPGAEWPSIDDEIVNLIKEKRLWIIFKEVYDHDYWQEYISPDLRMEQLKDVKLLTTNGYTAIFGEEVETAPDSTTD